MNSGFSDLPFIPKAVCNFCGTFCDNLCGGCCQAFYCSQNCQQRDWANHRRICMMGMNGNPHTQHFGKKYNQMRPPSSKSNSQKGDLDKQVQKPAPQKKQQMGPSTSTNKTSTNGEELEMPAIEKLQINAESQKKKQNDTKREVIKMPTAKKSQHKTNSQKNNDAQPSSTKKFAPKSQNNGNFKMPTNPNQPWTKWLMYHRQRTSKYLATANALQQQKLQESREAKIEKAMKEIKSEMPANNTRAVLTSFSSTNLVFIRSKEPDADRAYFEIAPKLLAIGKELVKLKMPPKLGAIVIVLHEGQFQRAQILKLEPVIKVILLESGKCSEVKFDNLYIAPDDIVNMRRLPVPVKLKGVRLEKISDNVQKYMTDNLEVVEFVVKYDPEKDLDENTGIYEVELFNDEGNESFNNAISNMIVRKDERIFDYEMLTNEGLPVGEKVSLYIVHNTGLKNGCIACSTKDIITELNYFEVIIAKKINATKAAKPYKVKLNELCFAKCAASGKWYRGRCTNLVDDENAEIEFIDYLFEERVNIQNIRAFSNEFCFKKPTVNCKITGLTQKLSNEVEAVLKEFLPAKKILMCDEVMLAEDGSYRLFLPEILKTINEMQSETEETTKQE